VTLPNQTSKNKINELSYINYPYEIENQKIHKVFHKNQSKSITSKVKNHRKSKKRRKSPSGKGELCEDLPSSFTNNHSTSFQFHANKTTNMSFTKRQLNNSSHQQNSIQSDLIHSSTDRSKTSQKYKISPAHKRMASVLKNSDYEHIESILNQPCPKNNSLIPSLDLSNQNLKNIVSDYNTGQISLPAMSNSKTKKSSVQYTNPEELSMFDMHQTQKIADLSNQNTRRSKQSISSQLVPKIPATAETVPEPKPLKYTKLLHDLENIEGQFDKHDISISMNQSSVAYSNEQIMINAREEQAFLRTMLEKISNKHKNSELNVLRSTMTKNKQTGESKVVNSFFSLLTRIIDSQKDCSKKIENYYESIIEVKDCKIDNLDIRLKTAMSHLKRIEEDRLKLKLDVDVELKKLEDIGNYDDISFPNELMDEIRFKSPDEDAAIALTDIYQFLLFEGDVARRDPVMDKVKTNFKGIKKRLEEQLSQIQTTTAKKVVKRIYRKIIPCDFGTQTPEDVFEKEVIMRREKEMEMFREKLSLQQTIKSLKADISKHKNMISGNSKLVNELGVENKQLQEQILLLKRTHGGSPGKASSNLRDSMKLKQYKDLVDKRDQQISRLLQEKSTVKIEMEKIMQRLTSMINESKSLKGDLLVKESAVTKLKKDLQDIR